MRQEAIIEYQKLVKLGQKEVKELKAAGKNPYPTVLDEILPEDTWGAWQDMGLVEIPSHLIVGTATAGRAGAFSASFYPLLEEDSEFGLKWINLCTAHLSDEGIREPVICYEYLGKFYILEGNKRVSVLKSFGSPRITGQVRRILPPPSEEPHIKAYYEFVEFYKLTKLYTVIYRQPGSYSRLLSAIGKEPGEPWTDREKRTFSSYIHYFREAFYAQGGKPLAIRAEEALFLWLKAHSFTELGQLSAAELKKSVAAIWEDVLSADKQILPQVNTAPIKDGNLLTRIITAAPDRLRVAFVHRQDPSAKWVVGHEDGRVYLEQVLGGKVSTCSYFGAYNDQIAFDLIEQAIQDGAQVIFTTSPPLSRPTLRAAVKYPKVIFLNNSVDTPLSCMRTYYGRIYEGKFINGAIAGAMADNNHIGYLGDYPILGVPTAINAFALGVSMTNPRAKVHLRWSCLPGKPVQELISQGIRVISNREMTKPDARHLSFGECGTYLMESDGSMTTLGSPCWVWGKLYERVIRTILSGSWQRGRNPGQPVSYWWGMDSGVIDVELSETLPDGVRVMAEMLRKGLQDGTIDPFARRIIAQDGSVKNDGTKVFTPDELLKIDWLCENVEGSIPTFDEVLPMSRDMVRSLGIFRDQIPPEKEDVAL